LKQYGQDQVAEVSLDKHKRWEAIETLDKEFKHRLTVSDGEYSSSDSDMSSSDSDASDSNEPKLAVFHLKTHSAVQTRSEKEFKKIKEKFKQNAPPRPIPADNVRAVQNAEEQAQLQQQQAAEEAEEYVVKKNRKGTFIVPKRRKGKKGVVHNRGDIKTENPHSYSKQMHATTTATEIVVVKTPLGNSEFPMYQARHYGGCGRRCEICHPPKPTRTQRKKDIQVQLNYL
jgi:hypothetical protein